MNRQWETFGETGQSCVVMRFSLCVLNTCELSIAVVCWPPEKHMAAAGVTAERPLRWQRPGSVSVPGHLAEITNTVHCKRNRNQNHRHYTGYNAIWSGILLRYDIENSRV